MVLVCPGELAGLQVQSVDQLSAEGNGGGWGHREERTYIWKRMESIFKRIMNDIGQGRVSRLLISGCSERSDFTVERFESVDLRGAFDGLMCLRCEQCRRL